VRVRAADALGTIGGPKVVEAVIQLLKEADAFIRRCAVEILNTTKDPRALQALIDALEDPDWWVQERAVDTLAALGDRRAVPALLRLLQGDTPATPAVLRALGSLSDPQAIPAVLAITLNAFIVYTSNVFAVLGLRSMYFAVAGMMDLFEYLHYGLSVVLIFIGAKMLASHYVTVPTHVALAVVAGVLALSVAASLVARKRRKT